MPPLHRLCRNINFRKMQIAFHVASCIIFLFQTVIKFKRVKITKIGTGATPNNDGLVMTNMRQKLPIAGESIFQTL